MDAKPLALKSAKQGFDIKSTLELFILSLIILNILAVVLESVKSIYTEHRRLFYYFEVFSIAVFTLEYFVRGIIHVKISNKGKGFTGLIRYIRSLSSIIDLLAILPFYLPFVGVDLRFLRMIRLLRIFRMLKVVRYLKAVKVISEVLKRKREELVVSILLILFLLLAASSVVYFIENEAQPEQFSSIPQTMWWGISTLTTVGYGDVYPITSMGKILGGIVSFAGVVLFALPAGIIASGFIQEISDKNPVCPHCGKDL